MEKLVQEPLILNQMHTRHAGDFFLATTAMIGFSLASPGALLTGPDAMARAMAALSPLAPIGVTLDTGLGRPAGEFLAAATACAPGGVPAERVKVTLAVGSLKRSFIAVGERYGDEPPKPFVLMPLAWNLAANDPYRNPFGVTPGVTPGVSGQPLHDALVFEAGNGPCDALMPGPASPLPTPMSLERKAIPGTYDIEWLKYSWPGYPHDYDYARLSMAQPAQRLKDGYFLGDEEILIVNAHPSIRELHSRLPGLRLRLLFVSEGDHLTVREIPRSLDVVWLFPHLDCGLAIWHSLQKVADEKASDVSKAIAAIEPLVHPMTPIAQVAAFARDGFVTGGPSIQIVPELRAGTEISGTALSPEPLSDKSSSEKEISSQELSRDSEILKAGTQQDSEVLKACPQQDSQPLIAGLQQESETLKPGFQQDSETLKPGSKSSSPSLGADVIPAAARQMEADLTANAKRMAEEALPEINKILASAGHEPLAMEDLTPFIEKNQSLAARALALSTAPRSGDGAAKAMLSEALERAGYSKERISGILTALEALPPKPSDFDKTTDFELAIDQYGQNFNKLVGASPGFGNELSLNLKNAALLDNPASSPQMRLDAAKRLLYGYRDAKFNPKLIQSLIGDAPPLDDAASLSWVGVKPLEAQALSEVLDKIAQTVGQSSSPAQAALKLKTLAPEIDKAMKLPPGTMSAKLENDISLMRKLAWSDPDVQKGLLELAEIHTELKGKLSEISSLCHDSAQPFDSLASLIKSTGVASPAILSAAAGLDILSLERPTPPPAPAIRIAGSSSGKASRKVGQSLKPGGAQKAAGGAKKGKGASAKGAEDRPEGPGESAGAHPGKTGLPKTFPNLTTRSEVEEWLAENPLPASMAGFNLAGLHLAGIDLSRRDLRGADLRGANLANANLFKANLSGASLDNASLNNAALEQVDFSSASLTSAAIKSTSLVGARLDDAILDQANLLHTDIKGIIAPGASFSETKLPRNMTGGSLAGASFRGVALISSVFTNCDCTGASFSDCNLSKSNFSGANLSRTCFYSCNLNSANLSGVVAPGACLELGCDLSDASLAGADLAGASLRNIKARGANLTGVSAAKANFSGADLAKAKMPEANLKNAILFRADLSEADLTGANMFKATAGGANFSGAVLANANLYGADLYRILWNEKTDFNKTIMDATCLLI